MPFRISNVPVEDCRKAAPSLRHIGSQRLRHDTQKGAICNRLLAGAIHSAAQVGGAQDAFQHSSHELIRWISHAYRLALTDDAIATGSYDDMHLTLVNDG